MLKKIATVFFIIFCLSGVVQGSTISSVPQVMQYQANLKTIEGINVDDDISVEAWIYNSPSAGITGDLNSEHLLYAESHDGIHIDRGVLRLSIGEGRGLGRFSGSSFPLESLAGSSDVYLQLFINDEKIEPRQNIAYTSAAFKSQYAKYADTLTEGLTITEANLPEEINASKTSGTLLAERLPSISNRKISGALSADRIASLSLSKLSSGTLVNDRIAHIDSSSITSDRFLYTVLPSEIMSTFAFVTKSGVVPNGGFLSPSPGFSIEQCKLYLGLSDIPELPYGPEGASCAGEQHYVDDIVLQHSIGGMFGGQFEILCEARYTPFNFCMAGGELIMDPNSATSCTASYLMICTR